MIFKRGSVFCAFQVTIGISPHDTKKRNQMNDIAGRMQLGVDGRELRLYYAAHDVNFDVFTTNLVQPVCPAGVSMYHLALRGEI